MNHIIQDKDIHFPLCLVLLQQRKEPAVVIAQIQHIDGFIVLGQKRNQAASIGIPDDEQRLSCRFPCVVPVNLDKRMIVIQKITILVFGRQIRLLLQSIVQNRSQIIIYLQIAAIRLLPCRFVCFYGIRRYGKIRFGMQCAQKIPGNSLCIV